MESVKPRVSVIQLVLILSGTSAVLVLVYKQQLEGLTKAAPARYNPLTKTFVGVTAPPVNLTRLDTKQTKLILYWTSWFGGKWAGRFTTDTKEGMREVGCPEWHCEFTYDRTRLEEAHAVLIPSLQFGRHPPTRRPWQRWVWVDVESPMSGPGKRSLSIVRIHKMNHLVNWTMTYHSNSDIMAFYGYFRSLDSFEQPLRPNFIENHPTALSQYLRAMAEGITLEDLMGASWRSVVEKPQLVAWLSSHCGTLSKREDYVQELSNYVSVGKYGSCGQRCGRDCWPNIIGRNYTFYLSLENSWCDDYVTEKLYMPLALYMVPVVWGAANYSRILPPNSYIDAREYHPKELAQLMIRLRADPVALGRYHLWRGFWEVRVGGNFCELCQRLHTDGETKHQADVPAWRGRNGRCQVVPRNMFAPGVTAWRKFIKSDLPE
nr:alpha-(1,3)-fucosyltransferase C-like [Penaeus vannamei]